MRDFDAWGSLDVSSEQLLSQLHEPTPQGRAHVGIVIGEMVIRASQSRQRMHERNLEELESTIEPLERLTKLLEGLIDHLDPPATD